VMERLETEVQTPMTLLTVICEFAQEQTIRHLLSVHEGQLIEVTYQQKVHLKLQVPDSTLAAFSAALAAQGCDVSQSDSPMV